MPVKIRILSAANKHMQRLGYLKLLAHHAARTETSSLNTLGNQLIDACVKRVRMEPPYSASIREYVQYRLGDSVYAESRRAILGDAPTAATMELQDVYLSDPRLPSTTGKLNDASREKYAYLGPALDLIMPGTWSAMTRSLTLLALVPREEIAAFDEYNEKANPLLLSHEQAALLLYCLIDNDAEIQFRLFEKLIILPEKTFDEKTAGNLLPEVIRAAVAAFGKASLAIEDRQRLEHLLKVASTIQGYKDRNYSGTTAREVSSRVRLEPFCDIGLLSKPDRHRFIYQITPGLRILMANWSGIETDYLLENRFFATLAAIHGLQVKEADESDARVALGEAGEALKSTLGYSPIKDCSLLAGIRLLFSNQKVLEIDTSRGILRAWQKAAPDIVRFTVDRMGELAYVKFLKQAGPPPHTQT